MLNFIHENYTLHSQNKKKIISKNILSYWNFFLTNDLQNIIKSDDEFLLQLKYYKKCQLRGDFGIFERQSSGLSK